MEISIDMLNIGSADAFVIWAKHNTRDYIIFIDGGKLGDGEKVVKHYNTYIEPHVRYSTPEIILINTHPHNDHVKGIPYILTHFGKKISRIYLNNPLKYISKENAEKLVENYNKLKGQDTKLTRLVDSLREMNELRKQIDNYQIPIHDALSDLPMYGQDSELFRFAGPSSTYYIELVNRFSSPIALEKMLIEPLVIEDPNSINEQQESQKPCPIVDEKNDTSAENLSSVITQFITSSGRKYLFTGDAGVESFESAKRNGFNFSGFDIIQLPHHGSRRNICSDLICEWKPNKFYVSAEGNKKHPRRAVIECIKKNTASKIYGTNKAKGSVIHYNSASGIFPVREGFTAAETL